MYLTDVLKVSALNVFRRRTRSILTALSIIIGIASVLLVSAIGTTGERIVISEIEKMGIQGITVYRNSDIASATLDENDIKMLESRFENITETLPVVLGTGSFVFNRYSSDAVLLGVGDRADEVYNVKILHGRIPGASDIKNKSSVSVIDDELARKVYKRTNVVGKKIVIKVNNKSIKTTIIGVISSQKSGINQMIGGKIPDFIYLPYTVLGELKSDKSIDQIAIKCKDAYNTDGKEFAEYLSSVKSIPGGYISADISAKIREIQSVTGLLSLLISAIAAIALVVASLGMMNTMFSSVIERKREIGICMAVGAHSSDILKCFIAESVLIALFGGAVGASAGSIAAFYIFKLINFEFVFDFGGFVAAILISVVCGVISSAVPAIKASKLQPIDALKN